MPKDNIMVGFEQLSKKQAKKLLAYGAENELQTVDNMQSATAPAATPAATPEAPRRRGRPPKTDGNGSEIILPRAIINAAKKYADKYGNDSKKTVCEHFGATTVTGQNGIPEGDFVEAMAIFQSDEEFIPDDDDGNDSVEVEDTDKKKKKKDKKSKEEKPEKEGKKKDKKKKNKDKE